MNAVNAGILHSSQPPTSHSLMPYIYNTYFSILPISYVHPSRLEGTFFFSTEEDQNVDKAALDHPTENGPNADPAGTLAMSNRTGKRSWFVHN